MLWIILGMWVACGILVFIYSILEDVRKNKEVLVFDICVALLMALLSPAVLVSLILMNIHLFITRKDVMRYRVYKAK